MDPNLSPMHEALRGATTKEPATHTFVQSNFHAPTIPYMVPTYEHSLPQYNTDIGIAPPYHPPPPPSARIPSVLPTAPPANISESARLVESLMNQEASSKQKFLVSPASQYSNFSDPLQAFSMAPPSLSSFLHGEPTSAAVNAQLSINEGHSCPIFQGTQRPIPHVLALPQSSCFPLESQQYSLKYMQQENKTLDSSSYKYPFVEPTSYKDPYGPSFGGSSTYSYPQRQQQLSTGAPSVTRDGMVPYAMTFDTPSKRVKRGYICRICDASFETPQAYGGHMSAHSKAAKKNNLNVSPPLVCHPGNVFGAIKEESQYADRRGDN